MLARDAWSCMGFRAHASDKDIFADLYATVKLKFAIVIQISKNVFSMSQALKPMQLHAGLC